MLTDQAIQNAVRRVVEAAHAPLKVILFGSYARGSATEGSDLDLLVVERGRVFAPTHDLARLAQALETTGAVLPVAIDALKRLNPYAVAFRYDDRDIHTVTRDDISALVDTICPRKCSSGAILPRAKPSRSTCEARIS